MDYSLGIDIGGTKIALGLLGGDEKLVRQHSYPTPKNLAGDAFVEALAAEVRTFLGDTAVSGCGIGLPAMLNLRQGTIVNAPNLPMLKGFPIRQAAQHALGCEVVIENDANLAGLAEFYALKNRDSDNMVFTTISTGVGGAIIIGGRLFSGDGGMAGEFGHMLLTPGAGAACNCKNSGCVESYCGGSHIDEWVRHFAYQYPHSNLVAKSNSEQIDGRKLFAALRAGDPLAKLLLTRMSKMLGMMFFNIYRVLDIHTFVLGGGLINSESIFLRMIKEVFDSYCGESLATPHFFQAVRGGDAGVIGAALLATQRKFCEKE